MTAQPDADSNADDDAIIIDLEAGRPKDCAVCREPAEWVAVGPCGHREVCVTCTVRLRFVDRNWRCCICRAFCPTVVVTRQQQAAGQPQEVDDDASFPKQPLAAGGAGQVGVGLSYHNGMAAYFDDRGQYEKARRMCLEAAARSSGAGVNDAPSQDSTSDLILTLIPHVLAALIGCGVGVLVAMHVSGNWLKRIPVGIACAILFHAVIYFVVKLIDWGSREACM